MTNTPNPFPGDEDPSISEADRLRMGLPSDGPGFSETQKARMADLHEDLPELSAHDRVRLSVMIEAMETNRDETEILQERMAKFGGRLVVRSEGGWIRRSISRGLDWLLIDHRRRHG